MKTYEETVELLQKLGKLEKREIIDHYYENGNLVLVFNDYKNENLTITFGPGPDNFAELEKLYKKLENAGGFKKIV